MLIQYVSDVHLEFLQTIPNIIPKTKILVLAGDIGYPHQKIYTTFLQDVSSKFEKVFLITGNHEYYTKGQISMETIDATIEKIIQENNLHNISFLHHDYEDYEGYLFVGLPLWSAIENPSYLINDFVAIQSMNTELYNELHTIGREFIQEMLQHSTIPIVMITHHMPSYKLIDPMYTTPQMAPYNQCFASHCDDLIKDPIKAWIYGHTHKASSTIINHIQLCCNPKGYPGENQTFHSAVLSLP